MPYGSHVARCFNCQKQWLVGDVIPAFCSPKCEQQWGEWWSKINAAVKGVEDDRPDSNSYRPELEANQ
jgi:hypothetical protein